MKLKEFAPGGGRPSVYSHLVELHMLQEFSPRSGRQFPRGVPTYEFAKCSQKLHEIERIWTLREGRASLVPPLRSTTVYSHLVELHTLQEFHLWCDTCWPLGQPTLQPNLSLPHTFDQTLVGLKTGNLSCCHCLTV